MENVNIAIAGMGGAGQAQCNYLKSVPNAKLAGVWDPYLIDYKWLDADVAIPKIYEKFDDILSDFSIDAVSICTPDYTHYEHCKKALEAGKHVIVEKPLTTIYEQALELVNLSRKLNLVVAVQHQMRFIPLFARIKKLIDQERVGTISYLEGDYVHYMKHRFKLFHDWRLHSKTASSIITGAGCHYVDLLRWLNGHCDVEEVFAYSNHIKWPDFPSDDNLVALLKFRNGVMGKIMVDFATPGPQRHTIAIYGSKGMIIDNLLFTPTNTTTYPAIYSTEIITAPPVGRLDKTWIAMKLLHMKVRGINNLYNYPFYLNEHSVACVNSLSDFVAAVTENRPPIVDVSEGAYVIRVCNAIEESTMRRIPISLWDKSSMSSF